MYIKITNLVKTVGNNNKSYRHPVFFTWSSPKEADMARSYLALSVVTVV